jgi:hypothetical protein
MLRFWFEALGESAVLKHQNGRLLLLRWEGIGIASDSDLAQPHRHFFGEPCAKIVHLKNVAQSLHRRSPNEVLLCFDDRSDPLGFTQPVGYAFGRHVSSFPCSLAAHGDFIC